MKCSSSFSWALQFSRFFGHFLTLKKMTMMANSLSHTTLLGIVIAYLIFFAPETDLSIDTGVLLVAALVSAVLTTLLTELARDLLKLQEDGYRRVSTTLFALGIILVTVFTRNSHLGVEVITGNVDALHFEDIRLVWGAAILNLTLIGLFFRQWVMTAFDEKLSFSLGLPTKTFHYLLDVFNGPDVNRGFPRSRCPISPFFPRRTDVDCPPVDTPPEVPPLIKDRHRTFCSGPLG